MCTAVISRDAELAWGFHEMATVPTNRVAMARRGWKRLLELVEEYRVPATWGMVGRLLPEQCAGIHAGHPAPEGWFDRDPRGSFAFEGTVRRARRAVGDDPIVRQAKHGLTAAIEHEERFHRCLHPDNVTDGFDLQGFEAVVEYIHRQRNQELLTAETRLLTAETRGEVADRIRSSGRPDTRRPGSKSNE